MWLFTTIGFLSVVRDADDPEQLIVRARTRGDLEAFCAATGAPAPVETPGRDYRWRTRVSPATFATHLARQAEQIDYPNFKDAVASRQGHDRAHRYHDVWRVMYDLQCAATDPT
jgi:hypothetical protein